MAGLQIGGQPVIILSGEEASGGREFTFGRAVVAPGRGMMLLQASGRIPDLGEVDLIHAPPLRDAAAQLDARGPDDFAGNLTFRFGGGILLPYANRIRGAATRHSREIETCVAGEVVRLPRNWGGRAPGAEHYAMHGLVLDRAPDHLRQPARNRVEAHFRLGDFEGRWPSKTFASIAWTLDRGRLKLDVRVRNVGDRPLPMGVGWHPYFALPSGDRRTARLQLPAAGRLVVNDYDEVLPTGDVLAVAGTPYDFAGPEGAALGTLYLDDCYVGLASGPFRAAVVDRAAGFSLCLQSRVPPVRAVQVYAPPEQAFVVLEPQTNWADPFGSAWTGREPPIALLAPGETLVYQVVAGLMPHQN